MSRFERGFETLRLRKPKGRYRAPTAKDILAFETGMGITLPDDFRDFLSLHAGCLIDAEFDVDPRCASGKEQRIEKFYDLGELADAYDTYADRLSAKLLPIGHDAMGNEIVLSLRANDHGAVFFLDRSEEASPGGKAKDIGLYNVAASFTAFLQLLRPVDGDEEDDDAPPANEGNPETDQILKQMLSGTLSGDERRRLSAKLKELAKKSRRE